MPAIPFVAILLMGVLGICNVTFRRVYRLFGRLALPCRTSSGSPDNPPAYRHKHKGVGRIEHVILECEDFGELFLDFGRSVLFVFGSSRRLTEVAPSFS